MSDILVLVFIVAVVGGLFAVLYGVPAYLQRRRKQKGRWRDVD
jgi:hypothetical protein